MDAASLMVAALTGATAILASWIGGKASATASRIQAEHARIAQEAAQVRTNRRAAYIELTQKSHAVGAEFRNVLPAVSIQDDDQRKEALRRVHERHTALHDEMMHALHVVLIEGPNEVAQAAYELEGGSVDMYFALAEMTEEGMRYNPNFDAAYHKFWDAFELFKSVARQNIH